MLERAINILLLALLVLSGMSSARAQSTINAGRKFAFGIPEGVDRQIEAGSGQSRVFLTFIGTTEGCAVVKGPDGFSAVVNFNGTREREIELPFSAMQTWEEGLNNKGFLVESTQPVTLELHVVFESAGESTQIYPMEMLDGDYLLSGWSLFNDALYGENNRAQFLVTAAEDNTEVTITAPNGLLPNIAPGTSFTVMLNAGDCYIGKMDSTLDTTVTTTHVIVKATKPVSVIQANTCGYVPSGVQSCNMLLDNILPRRFFGTKFYMQPISKDVRSDHILLTGDRLNFGAITSDGTFYQTNNGRLDIIIDEPTFIETDAPAVGQLLTIGSAQASLGLSDPTWVTIPTEMIWDDTLKWFAQPPVGGSQPFAHYITIVGPQTAFDEIMIDDAKLADIGTINMVSGTTIFTTQIGVPQGTHTLKSPEPVGAIVNGIRSNDAYSLLPGGTLPNRFQPRPAAQLDLTATVAQYCGELNAEFLNSLAVSTRDQIVEVTALLKYDPTVLKHVSSIAGTFFQSLGGVTIDASVPGELRINAKPTSYLTGTGTLIDAIFAIDADVSATTITGSLTLVNDEICDNARTFTIDLPITINKVIENSQAAIALSPFRNDLDKVVSADLMISGLQSDADVREFDVMLDWAHDLLELENILQENSQSDGWTITRVNETPTRVRLHVTAVPGASLNNGKLATLSFRTFLADTNETEIAVSAQLPSNRKCPLILDVATAKSRFNTDDVCGDAILRDALNGKSLTPRISPNPSAGKLRLDLAREVNGQVIVLDALGHEVARFTISGERSIDLDLPEDLASGSYVLRLEAGSSSQYVPFLLQK